MKVEKIGTRSFVFQYTLPEWNLNLHLIMGDTYNYVIDTGLGANSVAPIMEYLKDSDKPVIVINTHNHWDHVWANHCFEDSMIIAHEKCYPLLEQYWDIDLEKNKQYIDGEIKKKFPNILIKDSLYFSEDGIYIFYTPGHTPDSISVYDEKDKVLNAGDAVDDDLPILDMELEWYQKFLDRYQGNPVEICISGHNEILGKEVFDKLEEKRMTNLNASTNT